MDQCDTNVDLLKYMGVSDLYFMVQWVCLLLLSDILFVYIKKRRRPGVFVPLQALALVLYAIRQNIHIQTQQFLYIACASYHMVSYHSTFVDLEHKSRSKKYGCYDPKFSDR